MVTLEPRDPLQNHSIYARAPWFHTSKVFNHPLIQSHAQNGVLPRRLLLDVVTSRDWRGCIVLDLSLIRLDLRLGENLDRVREEMTRLAYKWLMFTPSHHLISGEYDPDVSSYCTYARDRLRG